MCCNPHQPGKSQHPAQQKGEFIGVGGVATTGTGRYVCRGSCVSEPQAPCDTFTAPLSSCCHRLNSHSSNVLPCLNSVCMLEQLIQASLCLCTWKPLKNLVEINTALTSSQDPELMGSLGPTTRQQVIRCTCTHTRHTSFSVGGN